MKLKADNYIEIYNIKNHNYFPVKILSINKNEIKVKTLIDNIEIKIDISHLETYGYRIPYISNKMIESCGFKKAKNGHYEKNNVVIIENYIGKMEQISNFFEINTAFLGFKILNKINVEDFFKKNYKTNYETKFIDFQRKNNTIIKVEDFFKELVKFGITDINFEELIIEQSAV
jgi:hypothetical protein